MKWEVGTVYAPRDVWLDAACHGQGVAMTMPEQREPGPRANARIARAKAICASCPVRTECLAWALSDPDPVGVMIAGGTTPKERRRMRLMPV